LTEPGGSRSCTTVLWTTTPDENVYRMKVILVSVRFYARVNEVISQNRYAEYTGSRVFVHDRRVKHCVHRWLSSIIVCVRKVYTIHTFIHLNSQVSALTQLSSNWQTETTQSVIASKSFVTHILHTYLSRCSRTNSRDATVIHCMVCREQRGNTCFIRS